MRAFVLLTAAALTSCTTSGILDAGPVAASLRSAGAPRANDAAGGTAADPAPKLLGSDGYTRLSAGSFTPDGDINGLDTGFYGQLAIGTELLPFLALEASLGYLDVQGPTGQELSALPLFVDGRAQLPIFVFEAYAGLGIGGMWADYRFGPIDDSEFLLASTAFAGLEFGVGNLAVGLEYRYLVSEETDSGFAIEGHSGLLTITLPF